MTKEQFKRLMIELYNNNQLFIPKGENIEDWINESFDYEIKADKL